MSNTERKKILNYRNGNGLAPNPDNIDYGEIAIGYKKGSEAIYIKNSANEIVDFTSSSVTPTSIVNLTYAKLKELRDNSKLKPSQYYRITDFVTTVANDDEARSAGHPFDIIVMASKENKLQEECYAIQHEGDDYFANCNLAAWKIWYCLDNDNTKYMWADTNGKGVIYRMIDEWQNDCPYDFKNVQFKRYWANGINITKNEGEPKNIILKGYYGAVSNVYIFTEGVDTNDSLFCFTFTRLNNILSDYEKGSVNQSNVLDESIQTEGLNRCRNNILKPTEEYLALILLNNVFITVKVVDDDDGSGSYQPPFDNTLGVSCVNNTFGNNCDSNTFGNNCDNNSFGTDCDSNTFGNNCSYNSFGDGCETNLFGNNCDSNLFGNNCHYNSFGNYFQYNTFGNYCHSNSFGTDCVNNSFGNYFQYNTFGNYCHSNSFGNYFRHNALGNDILYIEIPTEKIYHTQILNGTQGTDSKKLTIAFTPETTYTQFAGFTSDGVLKIWVEADDIVNITYAKLKELRDNSKLKPSQYYRITDFVTTVANDDEARSAGHPFDIIVLATDKNKLQEECYAIQHEDESDTYFDNCNLAAWKIWYCLDNDNTKYMWADTNGKGVIYRMIDEWNNDCPYDFKNVQYKRYRVTDNSAKGELSDLNGTYVGYNGEMKGLSLPSNLTEFVWAYTFSFGDRTTTPNDASITVYNNLEPSEGYYDEGYYGDNSIKPASMVMTVDSNTSSVFCLNNIVWWTNNPYDRCLINGNRIESECFNMTLSGNGTIIEHNCHNFIMGDGCLGNVFGTGGLINTFGNDCNNNQFGNDCSYNHFGNSCGSNSFGNGCSSNSFGYGCGSNSFGYGCSSNSFGYGCGSNSFGDDCTYNPFGNDCTCNSFGDKCNGNTFGNGCYDNSFGDGCSSNSFGTECNSNTFGNGCYGNSFGTECYGNSFGYGCGSNSFGNNCNSNTFGNDCGSNTFGDDCGNNSFGNYCHSNSFGTDCVNNSFGNYFQYNTFGNYFRYNALGNDVQYVEIATEKIYHTQILNGTKGTDSKKLTIAFTPETGYSQFAGLTSNNELKTWVEADVPTDVVDGGTY